MAFKHVDNLRAAHPMQLFQARHAGTWPPVTSPAKAVHQPETLPKACHNYNKITTRVWQPQR
jgi:hypothetical protein